MSKELFDIDEPTSDVLYAPVYLREGELIVKTIIEEPEKQQAFRLRHAVFAEELKWVPRTRDGTEIDDYDRHAIHFGVFHVTSGNLLLAYLRLMEPRTTYMLQREFVHLVSTDHKIRSDRETTEVTRLCLSQAARSLIIKNDSGTHTIPMFLYKGVYQWCLINGIRNLYMVVAKQIFRLFAAKGFPLAQIGPEVTMPDRVVAIAALMDWREFESLNSQKRPAMYRWFSRGRSARIEEPQQQLAAGSQHSAFSPHYKYENSQYPC